MEMARGCSYACEVEDHHERQSGLEEIETSLELGLAERITIGPCPPAD